MKPLTRILVIAAVLIVLVAALWLAGFIQLPQQQVGPKEPVKIGVLYHSDLYKLAFLGLKDKMAKDGYVEGKDMVFLIKELPDPTAANQATKELLAEGVKILYSVTTPVTTRVKAEAGNTPIIFNIVGDPVGPGFVESFATPGANLTGCTNLSASLSGKRLEIFKQAFPHIKKVVTFYDPANAFSKLSIADTQKTAQELGVEVKEVLVKSIDEIDSALSALKTGEFDGFYNTPDARVVGQIDKVVKRAGTLKIPVMGHEEDLANRGVAVTYGANFYLLGQDCAAVVKNIMRGNNPATEPVISPSKLELIINQATLDKIGLRVSQSILGQADKIIK